MYKLFVVLKPHKSKDADSEGDIGAGTSGYDLISLIIKPLLCFSEVLLLSVGLFQIDY